MTVLQAAVAVTARVVPIASRLKVLVVDTDLTRLLAVNRIFQARGALVDVTQSCQLAEQIYRLYQHDVVLCEARLIEGDSHLICAAKRAAAPAVVIAMTSDPAQSRELAHLRIDGFVNAACRPQLMVENCMRARRRATMENTVDVRDMTVRQDGNGGNDWRVEGDRDTERERTVFFAMLTHDIRNALSVISPFLEMLGEATLTDDQRHILERVEANVNGVITLTADYLSVASAETGQLCKSFRTVSLNDILRSLAEQYAALARKTGVTIETSLALDLPALQGDPVALERAFGNLIHNAIKFTPASGKICLTSESAAGEVIGVVADSGPGLTDEKLNLFDCFEHRPRAGRTDGSGVGLYAARKLVEAHGGRIRVQSSRGQGACFFVHLPVGMATPSGQFSAPVPGEEPLQSAEADIRQPHTGGVTLPVSGASSSTRTRAPASRTAVSGGPMISARPRDSERSTAELCDPVERAR